MKIVNPDIIGVPNQCLGDTIEDRRAYISKIVKHIRKKYPFLLLHILGCGDPQEIVAYAMVGADIFDSTAWYRNYIDCRNLYPTDYKVIEGFHFFKECSCRFCEMTDPNDEHIFGWFLRHNLEVYKEQLWAIDGDIKGGCVKNKIHKCS